MAFFGNREEKRFEKKLDHWRKRLSKHIFAVTSSEQNAPTHKKLGKGASRNEKREYLEYRMGLREVWVDAFLKCHKSRIPDAIVTALREEAMDDIRTFKENLWDFLDGRKENSP